MVLILQLLLGSVGARAAPLVDPATLQRDWPSLVPASGSRDLGVAVDAASLAVVGTIGRTTCLGGGASGPPRGSMVEIAVDRVLDGALEAQSVWVWDTAWCPPTGPACHPPMAAALWPEGTTVLALLTPYDQGLWLPVGDNSGIFAREDRCGPAVAILPGGRGLMAAVPSVEVTRYMLGGGDEVVVQTTNIATEHTLSCVSRPPDERIRVSSQCASEPTARNCAEAVEWSALEARVLALSSAPARGGPSPSGR